MAKIAPIYSLSGKRVWVAGRGGMVGPALLRRLGTENCTVITAPRDVLDLTRQRDVEEWMQEWQPQAIFLAVAKVGGIVANMTSPAGLLADNLTIATNVIQAAATSGVEKLIYLGSS
jgi:GDP-L-fucose synthase